MLCVWHSNGTSFRVVPAVYPPLVAIAQVRIIPDEHTSALRWVLMDFRLGRVREGSHKDCWLVERVIERDREGPPDVLGI